MLCSSVRTVHRLELLEKEVSIEHPSGFLKQFIRRAAEEHVFYKVALWLTVLNRESELRDRAMQLTLRRATEVVATCHSLARLHQGGNGPANYTGIIGRQARLLAMSDDVKKDEIDAKHVFKAFSNRGVCVSGTSSVFTCSAVFKVNFPRASRHHCRRERIGKVYD